MSSLRGITAVFLLLHFLGVLRAQTPRTVSYQGVLTTKAGAPIADGPHILRAVLYATRTGKVELYSKQDTVTTISGRFDLLLDSIPGSVPFDREYYLGL